MNNNWRMPVTVKTEGIPQSILALKRIRQGLRPAGARGMHKAVKYLLKETKKVTPKRTGLLRSSGDARVDVSGDIITGSISFYIYYAIWVHENLENYHKPGTYAKFLERTVKNRQHQTVARSLIREELVKEEMKQLRRIPSRKR